MDTFTLLSALEPKHLILALAALYAASHLIPRAPSRHKQVAPQDEHVLIIGASSGVGKELAKMYAIRGSRVCLVTRNAEQLKEAEKECLDQIPANRKDGTVMAIIADYADVHDMVRMRDTVLQSESYVSAPRMTISVISSFLLQNGVD